MILKKWYDYLFLIAKGSRGKQIFDKSRKYNYLYMKFEIFRKLVF